MPQNFSYLSILNPGFTAAPGTTSAVRAGEFAFVSLLNPPSTAGGAGGPAFTLSNANNVTFGSAGTVVTASASYAHVAPPFASAWSEMGAWVGTGSPGAGVQYSQWLAGSTGYWMWLKIP